MKKIYILLLLFLVNWSIGDAQIDDAGVVDYANPSTYEIGAVKVTGANFRDDNAIRNVAGLRVGDKIIIPGNKISKAIKNLWRLKLFTDVQIVQEKIIGDVVMLNIILTERPVLSRYSYKGVKKSLHEDLNDAIDPYVFKGGVVTDDDKAKAIYALKKYFHKKGYLDAEISIEEIPEEKLQNMIRLEFNIDRKERVKIQDIVINGNEKLKTRKIKKQMEETKEKSRIFSKSKWVKSDYETDKKLIIKHYNNNGFRDAKIVRDSIWREEDGDLVINIDIDEGTQYFIRDINWKGNSLYTDEYLTEILGIKKGDVYDSELLQQRLEFSMDGRDISSLYLDDGYLFFRVDPIEVGIEEDSIDIEMRMLEGPQATIDKVVVKGNDRTHEHVIRRELRTRPGEKFSRRDIIRSQRQLLNLGYFDPENFGINTPVNPNRGTVDIEYDVSETPSDQLELSAGWGGYTGIIGTLGVTFNNFSVRNIKDKKYWNPLPQGDGQRFSLRAQSNGDRFQSYNFSFTEPWFGGKKPTSFSVGGYYTRYSNGLPSESINYGYLSIARGFVGLGTQLKWPDDNFIFNATATYENISLNKYSFGRFKDPITGELIDNGSFNNVYLQLKLARNSVSEPIYPRSGSLISLTGQFTPRYSWFGRDVGLEDTAQDRFKFLEYHKWRLDLQWYTTLVDKLVFHASAKIGMLGFYDKELGLSPFERFELGGDGLNNQSVGITGKDIISLRGYEVDDIMDTDLGGAAVFDKITLELRYPISLNPSSTIYGMAFVQGGNAWSRFRDFNPFEIRRSAGVGVRIFLPMFGLLGFDYGFGFDKPDLISVGAKWTDFAKFSVILGFEPE